MRSLSHAALATVIVAVTVASGARAAHYCVCSSGRSPHVVIDPALFTVYDTAVSSCPASAGTELACADHGPYYDQQGWIQWRVTPKNISADRRGAYYASGFLEGWVTHDAIWATFSNTMLNFFYNTTVTPNVTRFVLQQIDYINTTTRANPQDRYWGQVGALFALVEGITDGYNARVATYNASSPVPNGATVLSFFDVWMTNLQLEVADIGTATTPSTWSDEEPSLKTNFGPSTPDAIRSHLARPGHCSAMIRITSDDLFMTHLTWMYYNVMLRAYKVYNFETTVSLSGYPGMIASFDDWYMTSNGLSVQETTNILYNNSLFRYLKPTTVSEFMRVMAANYLATSGSDWVTIASTENSGTYNNQWMVVDHNVANPLASAMVDKVPDGTLWIYEQLPGPFSMSADVSHVVRDNGYWASYNLPYFPEVYNITGNLAMYEKYGSYFSYTEYARPQIFRREAPKVQSAEDVRVLMRYNNYAHEPFAVIPNATCVGMPDGTCHPSRSAMLTIASRGDLDPYNCSGMGTLCSVGAVGQQNVGAIDAKLTSWSMMMKSDLTPEGRRRTRGQIICGPPFGGYPTLPAFEWNVTALSSLPRLMIKDVFTPATFEWLQVDNNPGFAPLPSVVPSTSSPSPAQYSHDVGAIVGGVFGGLVVLIIASWFVLKRCETTSSEGGYQTINSGSPAFGRSRV